MIRPAIILAILLPLVFGQGDAARSLPACTDAQHARYQALGPDGRSYPTWHPLIDHAQGCVHSHEHGSDPALVAPGYRPLFGYSTAARGLEPEPHAGFKGYAFSLQGYAFYLVHHQGSGGQRRACVEHHTVAIAAWRDGVLVADLHMLPSFGNAVINETGQPITSCPQTSTSGGVRMLPDASGRSVGYEPWRVGWRGTETPFLRYGDLTFNVKNPQTACADSACASVVPRTDAYGPATGTYREVTFEANHAFWLRASGSYQGVFDWEGARQYIAPGVDIQLGQQALAPVTSAARYVCVPGAPIDAAQYMRLPIAGSN